MSIVMFFNHFFVPHMCLRTVFNEKLTTSRKIYWSYIKLAPSLYILYVKLQARLCVLLCSTHINRPVTKHVLPVLLTFIQCDSRVLKMLQNAWQIHHRDHYLGHSTKVFQRYAICRWKIMCVVLNTFLQTQDNKFVLITKSRLFSPAPTSLFCRLISSFVFAKRFSHFLLQSETVRWNCGKVVLMVRAMSSQAFLLSWVETPVLHFPLIMFFFSCTNWARKRHSWSVQLGLLFLLDVFSMSSKDICLKEKHTCFKLSVRTFHLLLYTFVKYTQWNKWNLALNVHAQEGKTFSQAQVITVKSF